MAEEKKVKFTAEDNISSFMKKTRQENEQSFKQQLSNAQKLTNSSKDQLKFLKDYNKEFQYRSKIENDFLKESIRMRREYGGAAAQASATEDEARLKSIKISQKAQSEYFKSQIANIAGTTGGKPSTFSEILKAGLLRDLGGLVSQIPNSRNGLEGITTMAGIAGTGAGALLAMPLLASAAGAQIGKSVGEFFGTAMTRHLTEQSRYTGAVGRLRGAGGGAAVEDLSYLGLDLVQSASLREQLVRSTGIRNQGASHLAEVMKAYSLDGGLINQYATGTRYGGGVLDLRKLLGTAGESNRPSFDRLIQTQTQLTNLIAQSAVNPNANNIAKSLFEFNSVGGPFRIGDPRSLGLMSTINDNIVNPSSPLSQAMNYSILRRMNPNMGIASLLEEQQRGISNRGLTAGILNEIEQMGGTEDFKILATAQRFGLQGNIGAARKLFEGRGGIGQMSDQDFREFTDQQIRTEAEANVPILEKNQAQITNAFVVSMSEGILTVAGKFKDAMEIAATEAANDIRKRIEQALGTDDHSRKNDATWDRFARKVK